jgi:hypothetical protein
MFRTGIKAARESTDAKPGSGGRANVSNPIADKAGAALKVGGRVLVGVTVVQQAVEIANSPDPAREVAGAGGLTLGAIAGGESGVIVGAQIGAFGGPAGAVVGAVIGGVVGAAAGGVSGEYAAEGLFDQTRAEDR